MASPASHEGDEQIIGLLRSRDPRGVEVLLRVHGGRTKALLQIALRLPSDDHCLEDAVCDASLLMLRHAKKLDPNGNLAGYFYVTARRELVRILKRLRRWHRPLWDGAEEQVTAPEAAADAASPLSAQVRQIIDRLSDLEREILTVDLANNFALRATEVAAILGTTEATVFSLRNRSKGKLRRLLPEGAGSPRVP